MSEEIDKEILRELLRDVNTFFLQVDAISGTARTVNRVLELQQKNARLHYAKELRKNRKFLKNTSDKDYEAIDSIRDAKLKLARIDYSRHLWLRSQIILLVGQFEAFFGKLVRRIIEAKPKIVENSERSYTFAQLLAFVDIDDAVLAAVNAEVEAVMRLKRDDKFKWLQRTVGLKLESEPTLWSKFVEVVERRHCLTHSDGEVTQQYIDNCTEAKTDWKIFKSSKCPKLGGKLGVSTVYLNRACSVYFEMAAKLVHFVARVLFPGELETLDQHLNLSCIYENLIRGNFDLAKVMATYAIGLPRHASKTNLLMMKVNLAITCKHLDKPKELEAVINGESWDIFEDQFKLAIAAIREDVPSAVKLIRKIGTNGDINKHSYRVWPVFHWIREKEEFRSVFEEVHGEPLSPTKAGDSG